MFGDFGCFTGLLNANPMFGLSGDCKIDMLY